MKEGLQFFIDGLNQLFALERKIGQLTESRSMQRNLERLQDMFTGGLSIIGAPSATLRVHDPIGESYNETRTDCSASIAGEGAEDLVIVEVIKPIIHLQQEGMSRIIQKGVVIVKERSKNK